MRPQNNKNRMRGRGRKPSNPLNRNYESNGPDVKIRGNASHIAEKYAALARDALSSGDRVIAENYLQHAEHYNRIIMAANAQREEAQQTAQNRSGHSDDRDDDQSDDYGSNESDVAAAKSGQRDSDGENEEGKGRKRLRRRDASGNPKANGEGGAKQSSSEDGDGGKEKEEAAASSDVPKRRTSRKKSASSDAVSSDAASLPQGLIGEISEPATADK
jgi:hypothetical protein